MHAYVGLGANLGDCVQTFERAAEALGRLGRLVRGSALYHTAPVGPPQPEYLNAAVLLAGAPDPPKLLAGLLAIEAGLGRVRPTGGQRDLPRVLDLDLLLLGEDGQVVWHGPEISVPHPRLHQRLFALVPLLDIRPDLRHPELGVPLRDLAAALRESGQPEPRRAAGPPPWRSDLCAGEEM